jgi:hypothetical protein
MRRKKAGNGGFWGNMEWSYIKVLGRSYGKANIFIAVISVCWVFLSER